MPSRVKKIAIYIEAGEKRAFAGAIEWPGWSRSGRDEESAIQALFDYAPRYARALGTGLGFELPEVPSVFHVVERLSGNGATDFGVPGMPAAVDAEEVSGEELERFEKMLRAFWRAFDYARRAAAGKDLRKGPRGGGREMDAIVEHVIGGDQAYLARVGWKLRLNERDHIETKLDQTRQALLGALEASAGGKLPVQSPRGSVYWTPRYFMRRVSWHTLDHTWEIEDRSA